MTDHLTIWRTRTRWFAAEFLVIVTGVLVALALNALYQRSLDARHEANYFALLNRDLGHTTRQLEEKAAFEAAQLRDGLAAYRLLSAPVKLQQRPVISAALAKLADRRTMMLRDATYADLVSTGNLRLIRNRELRDQIVGFYGTTHGDFEVMNRNNAYFVDGLYNSLVIGQGLIRPGTDANLKIVSDLLSGLMPQMRGGYIEEPDYLWSLPPTAAEWAALKATLVARIRIAALSEQSAQVALRRTRELTAALQAELDD